MSAKQSKSNYPPSPTTEKTHGKRPTRNYANAVKNNSPSTSAPTKTTAQNLAAPKHAKEQSDDRLFLRLSEDNPLRKYSGFALLGYIKSKLGSDKELINNVLPTKTGFCYA